MNDIFKYNRSESEDYYQLLGCSIHSTDEQIQKEYKIRALTLHPDKNEKKEVCNKQFQRLKKAKEILLDKEMRSLYDRWLLGGVMMSFEQFQNYTKNNCQSFHWAAKKSEPMLTFNSTSNQQNNQQNNQQYNQQNNPNDKLKLERKSSKLNLRDTPVFKTNDFVWARNETNDLLKKFRNYEI